MSQIFFKIIFENITTIFICANKHTTCFILIYQWDTFPDPLVWGKYFNNLPKMKIGAELSHDVLNPLTYHFNGEQLNP